MLMRPTSWLRTPLTSTGVPLPDGRSIPVTMKGGAQAVNIVIHNTIGSIASQSDVVQGMKAVRAQIIGELSRGQRMGGAYA